MNNLIKFAVWYTLPGGQLLCKKMVYFGEGTMELCWHEISIFFLPVNMHINELAFLVRQHTTMCLDKCTCISFAYF